MKYPQYAEENYNLETIENGGGAQERETIPSSDNIVSYYYCWAASEESS